MTYASGGWRWLNGTPSIPSLFAASEGPKIVRRAGIDRIRAKSVRQTEHLIALAEARGYSLTAPRNSAERGGTVAFDVPHAYEMAQLLLSKNVVVDYRPGAGIRLAPHFYTADSELDRAVALIDEGLASGEWKQFEARRAVVT
jgi:kynureninase